MVNFNRRFLLLILPLAITLLLPTSNSSQDGYGFAAGARWNHDIFESHHLLYTTQLYLVAKQILVNNTLLLGKILNSFYLFFCILVLYRCLRTLAVGTNDSIYYSFFSGCFFSSLRFATENETYILPILFSLIGTYFFLQFKVQQKINNLLLSGFFLAIACLFHQIQFFWWLVLWLSLIFNIKQYGFRPFLVYSIPAIIVPISYGLVIIFYLHQALTISNFIFYVFQTFFTGTASLNISYLTFVRWWISMARTVLQIHPSMLLLIKTNILYLVWIIINVVFLSCTFIWFIIVNKGASFKFNPATTIFGSIIFLNLTYSLLGGGNSEFMVMLPFLLIIFFANGLTTPLKGVVLLGITLLIWNVSLGLLPSKKYNFFPYKGWVNKIINDEKSTYFMFDAVEIGNIIYYQTGKYPDNCLPITSADVLNLKTTLDSIFYTDKKVFTNYLSEPIIKNSAFYLRDARLKSLFDNFNSHISDSVQIFNEKEYLFEIKKGHKNL